MGATGQLAVRRTGPHTVHLLAAAAGPLGGDTAAVVLRVEAGARLAVRSVAAAAEPFSVAAAAAAGDGLRYRPPPACGVTRVSRECTR